MGLVLERAGKEWNCLLTVWLVRKGWISISRNFRAENIEFRERKMGLNDCKVWSTGQTLLGLASVAGTKNNSGVIEKVALV